jgi:hypothetical protein
MFTPEIITMLGGSLLGGLLKIWKARMDNRRHELDLLAAKVGVMDASSDAADKRGGTGGPLARRFMVIVVLFAVFLAPFILAAWFPEVPIFYAYTEANGSGFWFLRSTLEQLKFVRLDGFVLLPIHTQMASAIAGFYFGAGVAK